MKDYESKLFDSSRQLADMLVSQIGNNQEEFDELFKLSLRDSYPISMRASRVLQLCAQHYPYLIDKHLDKVIASLSSLKVEGVKRAFLGMLIPRVKQLSEDQLGIITDLCFSWVKESRQAIAVRAYSMDIILEVIKIYPDLRYEMIETLETIVKDEKPSMQGRIREVLKKLQSLKRV